MPLFITQFFGAFNDNLMKAFVVVMIAYSVWNTGSLEPEVIVSMAAGLFILPFVIFCPMAGSITDKYDKALILQRIKIAEILIVIAAIFTIYLESTLLAMIVLLALGTQSAFFSPGKFSILPQHLTKEELIGGNGLISTGTYLAILAGTIFGTIIALKPFDKEIVSALLMACAVIGYLASLKIPPAPPQKDDAKLNLNPFSAAFQTLKYAYLRPDGIFWAILSVSWFYFVAGTIHSQFPNFVKQSLNADTAVLTTFMITFSLGIAIGGLLNNRLLKSQISTRFVPIAALAIAGLSLDMYFSAASFEAHYKDANTIMPLAQFIQIPASWRIFADIFLLSVAGGLYIVPIRTHIQHKTPEHHTAQVMAGNALTDSLFILLSSILATILLSMNLQVKDLFGCLSLLTALVAFLLIRCKKF